MKLSPTAMKYLVIMSDLMLHTFHLYITIYNDPDIIGGQ